MERITKEQIAKVFEQDELNPEEILALIEKDLGIKIDPKLPKKDQIDQVYEIYTKTMDELEAKTKEEKKNSKKKKKKSSDKPYKLSRKDFVISLIEEGKYTRPELIEVTDKKFDYEEGKSSKGRVAKVIKELKAKGQLSESKEGILSTK